MTKATECTKEQWAEVETILTLLAGSNRWPHYVGLTQDTEKIDMLIEQGDLTGALIRLRRVTHPAQLALVALRARRAHLAALQAIEDEEEFIRERTTLGDMVDEDYDHPRPTSQLLEGCPTDEEIQLTQAIGDLLEEQVFATAEELPLEGCPTDEEIQIASWSEGRGYGDFPKEGL